MGFLNFVLPSLISGGSALATGILGNQAAGAQSDAALKASSEANALQKYIYDNNQKIAAPWLQQGGSAVNRLGWLLGLNQGSPAPAAAPQGGAPTGGGQTGDYFPSYNPSQFNAFNDPFFSSNGYFNGNPSNGSNSPQRNPVTNGGGQFGQNGSGYGYPGQLLAPDGNSPYDNFSSDSFGPGSFDGNGYANLHPGNIGGMSWDTGLGGGLGDGDPLSRIFGDSGGAQREQSTPAQAQQPESFANFSNAASASGMLPLHSYGFSAENPANAGEAFGQLGGSNFDTGPHGRVSGGAGLYAQYPGDPTPSRLQSYQNGNGLSNYLLTAPANSGSVAYPDAPGPAQGQGTAPAQTGTSPTPVAVGTPAAQGDSPYGTAGEFGSLNKDFGLADFQTDPGYQFRIQQGQKALEHSAASRGSLFSGGTLKALDQYNQNFASNEFGNAYNRFQINRTNKINPLLSLAGLGQQSAQQMQTSGSNYANNAGANTIAGLTGAANAQASGYASTANAINGAGNNITNLLMLRNLGLGG